MSVKCFINDQTSQVRQEAEESTPKLSVRVSFSFPGNCHLKALLFIHFRMLCKIFVSNVAEMRQSNTTNRRWCETSEVEDEWALSYVNQGAKISQFNSSCDWNANHIANGNRDFKVWDYFYRLNCRIRID